MEIAIRRTQSVISEEHEKETITCAGKLGAVILTLIFDELMNRGILEEKTQREKEKD
ncbi:3742_t:CDS:2 [Gigaspora margarita]|uniref:3742_t:CDS:1 n=1 Tax=Gigaspora margarita TaxID=4874 RepID=A0ABM8W1V0_GIGMA|nr:3742_t:CDS:2 [Gigaspora margarita]